MRIRCFLGNPAKQNLANPQSLNSYSYAYDNPIDLSDPNGLAATIAQKIQILQAQVSILQGIVSLYQGGQRNRQTLRSLRIKLHSAAACKEYSKEMVQSQLAPKPTVGTTQMPNITTSLNKDMQAHAADPLDY